MPLIKSIETKIKSIGKYTYFELVTDEISKP